MFRGRGFPLLKAMLSVWLLGHLIRRQLFFAEVWKGDFKVSSPKILWVKCPLLERAVY